MAITFTSADLDALKEALLSGATEVSIGDRRIRYKSQAEIIQAIKMVQAALDGVPSESTTQIAATFSKGQK
jgi:hypothetical protein